MRRDENVRKKRHLLLAFCSRVDVYLRHFDKGDADLGDIEFLEQGSQIAEKKKKEKKRSRQRAPAE